VTFAESEIEEIEPEDCNDVVVDDQGDYLLEDKSQIVSIVDFRAVPRNESARQQARRELVIQMLIAESMSNWDKLYKRLKHEEKAKRRAERRRLNMNTCASLHSSASSTSTCRSLLNNHSEFNNNNKLSIINDISFNYKWKHTLKHCMGRGVGGGMGGSRSTSTLRESVCSSTNDLHIWQPLLSLSILNTVSYSNIIALSVRYLFLLTRLFRFQNLLHFFICFHSYNKSLIANLHVPRITLPSVFS